ncbi:hypothetical protein [Actinokineospora inagensis]|uniref:hypothetical protein n=1 Tax=Actinokineospora inagensis TaxID=103730 RepID=UPI000479533A|nr:hypothetical protein [Actinokineospora inagensis]
MSDLTQRARPPEPDPPEPKSTEQIGWLQQLLGFLAGEAKNSKNEMSRRNVVFVHRIIAVVVVTYCIGSVLLLVISSVLAAYSETRTLGAALFGADSLMWSGLGLAVSRSRKRKGKPS